MSVGGTRRSAQSTSSSELMGGDFNREHVFGTNRKPGDYNGKEWRKKTGDVSDQVAFASPGTDSKKDEYSKVWERCISASTKGFVIGAGLRGGLGLVAVLSRLRRKERRTMVPFVNWLFQEDCYVKFGATQDGIDDVAEEWRLSKFNLTLGKSRITQSQKTGSKTLRLRPKGANPKEALSLSLQLYDGCSLSGKTDAEAIKVALKETFRYGLFVGTFAGSFCTVDELIAAIAGGKSTAGWRSLVAGALAGPSLLLTGSQPHTSMAIYIFMRASVLAARCGIKSERMSSICRPLTWKHGDTFLMCLSSSQILYAWIMHPNSLPASYVAFLNKHGGKDISIVHGISALAAKQEISTTLAAVEQHYLSTGVNVHLSPDIKIPCMMVHAHQGCVNHFFSFIGHAYLRSLPVYLPVYLVPAFLVHRQGLFLRPLTLLSKNFIGTARSSLFLATYCASAWLWTCVGFRAAGTCSHPLVLASTFPTGLALLIEKKSRRMELALYCLSRAVESFTICLTDTPILKQQNLRFPNRGDVVLFSLATSIIMHCYAEERDVFRSKYLNVLDWVFGVPNPQKLAKLSDTPLKDKG